MAHFFGSVQGSRGQASRLGGQKSGMEVVAAGWHTGARVVMDCQDGKDRVRVYQTSGSSGTGYSKLIAEWTEEDS